MGDVPSEAVGRPLGGSDLAIFRLAGQFESGTQLFAECLLAELGGLLA